MRSSRIFCPELSSPRYKCTNIKQIHHLAKVLRLRPNDSIELFDGRGNVAKGNIHKIGKSHIDIDIGHISSVKNPYQRHYQAVIPYIKKENLMYSVQKLVEIGAHSILIYKPNKLDQSLAKRDLSKLNIQVEGAVIAACEQSGCNFLPKITYFNGLKESIHAIEEQGDLEGVFVLDTIAKQFITDHESLSANNISLISGPESGFSETERLIMSALELKTLKIGHYILRAETAPIIGLTKFHNLFGEY